MIICSDIDDTIEELLPAWLDAVNKYYNLNVQVEDVTQWHLTAAYPNLTKDQIAQFLFDPDIWTKVKPKLHAAETLQKLIADGHDIYLVTNSHYKTLIPKIENMLNVYFPFIDLKHLIICANKQLIKCDIMIDDYYGNLVGGDYIKLLMNTPYNADFDVESESNMIRVYDWDQIYSIICQIEKGMRG